MRQSVAEAIGGVKLARVWIQNYGSGDASWRDKQINGPDDECPDLEFVNVWEFNTAEERIVEVEAVLTPCGHGYNGFCEICGGGCFQDPYERVAKLEAALVIRLSHDICPECAAVMRDRKNHETTCGYYETELEAQESRRAA